MNMHFNCIRYYLFLPVLLALLTSCGSEPVSPLAQFDRKVRLFLRDGGISEEESSELLEMVSTEEEIRAEIESEEGFVEYINTIASKYAERSRDPISLPVEMEIPGDVMDVFSKKTELGDSNSSIDEDIPSKSLAYNFYLENSGSMYGYLNEDTAFKDVILGLMTNINRYDEQLNISFANDTIYKYELDTTLVVSDSFDEFIEYLNPRSLKKIGDYTNTNLTRVISDVINVKKEEDEKWPSILFSDFIFSIAKTNDVRKGLSTQKHGITTVIHNGGLKEKNIGFLVLVFNSKFTGTYYNYKNQRINLNNVDRPYYIWVLGEPEVLKSFTGKYKVDQLKGFQKQLLILPGDVLSPFSTILKKTGAKGRFNLKNRQSQVITSIEDIEYDNRGKKKVFRFTIAIDVGEVPVDEEYLKNIKNWKIESSAEDVFGIVRIKEYSSKEISPLDKKYIEGKNVTHLITLETNQVSPGRQELNLALLKHLPSWVKEKYSTNDDTNMSSTSENLSKTFGFEDLIKGVWEEYTTLGQSEEYYLNVTYSLER